VTVEAVPSWLVTESTCKWPSRASAGTLKSLLREPRSVAQESWERADAGVLGKFGKYLFIF
jgi:hypothetical protein